MLGRLLEENLRRALAISRGDLGIFIHRPVSAWLLFTGVIVLVLAVLPTVRTRREEVFVE